MSLSLFAALGGSVSVPQRSIPAPGRRIDRDAYYTPDRLCRAIVSAVHQVEPVTGVVLEPSGGGGGFVRALLDLTPAEVAVADLDPEARCMRGWSQRRSQGERIPCAFLERRDFLSLGHLRPDWVVGNPEYAGAEAHVVQARGMARHVVFLLRLAFLSSAGRIPFWKAHPLRHLWSLAERPSFTGGGTDSADYGVFWWDRDHTGPTTLTPGWSWKTVLSPEP